MKTRIAALLMVGLLGAAPAHAAVLDIDVSGIFSNDGLGAPINEVRTFNIGANAQVTGIGWDVVLFADAPSWLSEMAAGFGPSGEIPFLNLRPGAGDNFPGTQSYSSGGIVDLVDLGLSFFVSADGILRLEFFETFVDYPGDWDGIWESGTITVQYQGQEVSVPEPGTLALLGLGLIGFGLRRRAANAV
jgi:hypothetical protein